MRSKTLLLFVAIAAALALSCNFSGSINENSDCSVNADPGKSDLLLDPLDLPNSIAQFLNQRGTDADLERLLIEEQASPLGNPLIFARDFAGDGSNDLVIAFSSTTSPSTGNLFLFVCAENQYQLAFSGLGLEEMNQLIVYSSDDLSQDNRADIMAGIQSCGAHTCFLHLEVLVWDGASFSNTLQGSSDDLPSPIVDFDIASGEIVVTATGINSVGAGPFRSFERHWQWDTVDQVFAQEADVLLPTDFRIHILQEAEGAFADGDYEGALELYDEVISNDDLQSWVDPAFERPNLEAYAMFRVMLTHLMYDDANSSENVLRSLQDRFLANSVGFAFVGMAEVFWDAYITENDISSACKAVEDYAVENSTFVIEPLYHGYANPTYTPADLCPIS